MSDVEVISFTDIDTHKSPVESSAVYAFTDVETTGFDSLRNCVITLSTYVTDIHYNIIGEHHGKFRPDGAKDIVWSMGAEEIHKITWAEAIQFPPISESGEEFLKFLEQFPKLIFVAHNAPFDKRMLNGTLSKVDGHFRFNLAFNGMDDTVKMIKESGLTSGKSKSLGAVCIELGIEHNHHDAKSDAFVLIEIHRRCRAPKQDEFINDVEDRTFDEYQET